MTENWETKWEDYYEILQVHPSAEQEVIKGAYDKLARKYHPDLNSTPSASKRMKAINEAYNILSDTEKRNNYHLVWLRKNPSLNTKAEPHTNKQESINNESSINNKSSNAPSWFAVFSVIVLIIFIIAMIYSPTCSGSNNTRYTSAYRPITTASTSQYKSTTTFSSTNSSIITSSIFSTTKPSTTSSLTTTTNSTTIPTPRTVFNYSGNGSINTPSFTVQSSPWLLRYTVNWKGSFYIEINNHRIVDQDVIAGQTYETYIYNYTGVIYLETSCFRLDGDTSWTMSVIEYPPTLTPKTGTVFSYSGIGSMNTPSFTVQSSPWLLRYTVNWKGSFYIEINNHRIVDQDVIAGQTYETYIYDYTGVIYLETDCFRLDGDTSWTISVIQ